MASTPRLASPKRLLVALVGGALLLAACSSDASDQQVLTIPADPDQASPAPEPADAATPDSDGTSAYDPLDLSFLDVSASSSALPSAVPAGLETGFTEDGYPYRGGGEAAVTLIEYSDYACPFCGRYTSENVPALLEQYATTGQVRFVFREFPLEGIHPTAPIAHTAAMCAGEQGAEAYWAVHDEIFARQADWTQLSDPTELMAEIAGGVGVDLASYTECVESGRKTAEIQASVEEIHALGFNGTPSFVFTATELEDEYTIVGARPLETFSSWLDSLLAGEPPDEGEEAAVDEEPAELPFWVTPEGLSADAERDGVTQGGDFYRGNPDASVTVIEFSDFQCPFCLQQYLESEPHIEEELIDTGDVMWVFKHLPLAVHPQAPLAAAAADCAGEQARFWDMHDALFESVEQWGNDGAEPVFRELAASIGLDETRFTSCLESRAALEGVVSDLFEGRALGVLNAPSFVVFSDDRERGSLIEGFTEGEQFVRGIRTRLEEASG